MFTRQLIKLSRVAFGAAVLSTTVMTNVAQAADPVMNQNNAVYEQTLKFYLHPARLEVTEPTHEMMEHPAVVVARRPKGEFDWTSAFILHPARLAITVDEAQPFSSTVRIAQAK